MSTPQDQLGIGSPQLSLGATPQEQEMETNAIDQFNTNVGKMQDVAGEQAKSIKDEESQLSQMQPPEMDKGALFPAPYLVALAAIGGSAMKVHARVMLGALNGMVQGALKGDEMAYEQGMEKYKLQYQKLRDLADLQNQYYDTLYKSYGSTAEAQMRAFTMMHELTDDKFKQNMAIANLSEKNQLGMLQRMIAQQNLAEKVRHDEKMEQFAGLRMQATMMSLKQKQQMGELSPEELKIGGKVMNLLGPSGMGAVGMNGQTLVMKIKMAEAANPGLDADSIAHLIVQGTAHGKEIQAGSSVAGRREYQVSTALSSIMRPQGLLDLAIQSAKEAGIGNTKGFDWVNVNLAKYQNNPAMRTFIRRMADIRAEYAQALAKGGMSTEGGAQRSEEAIPQVVTLSELESMRKTLPEDMQAILGATQTGMESLTGEGGGEHKDGDKAMSKSGKPMVWRDGGWVYE